MSCGRNHRLHDRPFGISQITRITKAAAVRGKAVFGLPHRALSKESSAQQGITSDSFDSRSFRIGSERTRSRIDRNDARHLGLMKRPTFRPAARPVSAETFV